MIKGGVPIGRVFGIPIRLHYSWFFIFALITWALATSYFPLTHPTWTQGMSVAAGLITSLLFFGSVVFHELMHSRVALAQGMTVQSITLFILGGVSQITEEPKQAKDEFRMAFAGPLSSLVLGGVFWGIGLWTANTNQFISAVALWVGYINIILGIFNLIPGFPLDGGRVLRSLIWWRNQNLQSATRIASNIGRGIGYLGIFGGIWLIFTGNWWNGIWFALIGWFLESAAAGSYRQLMLQDMLQGHTAGEIMTRDCLAVSPDITVERLVNENILTTGRRCFPVVAGNRLEGLVTLDNVRSVPRDRWPTAILKETMTTLDHLKSVGPNESLSNVLKIMTESDINQVPVVQDSNVIGMVSRDNLLNFINLQSSVRA
ncbi:MAG: site-2 protease family protein [Chloroflexota bacterium]|nr:site-2 protease family protein [Chloroflexota bacterium]